MEDKDQERDKFDIEENLQVAEAAVRWLGAPIVGVTIILLPVTGDDERWLLLNVDTRMLSLRLILMLMVKGRYLQYCMSKIFSKMFYQGRLRGSGSCGTS